MLIDEIDYSMIRHRTISVETLVIDVFLLTSRIKLLKIRTLYGLGTKIASCTIFCTDFNVTIYVLLGGLNVSKKFVMNLNKLLNLCILNFKSKYPMANEGCNLI